MRTTSRTLFRCTCTIVKLDPIQKNFRTFRYDDGELEGTEWNNIGRYSAYDLSPYDETLLIDSDYLYNQIHLQTTLVVITTLCVIIT